MEYLPNHQGHHELMDAKLQTNRAMDFPISQQDMMHRGGGEAKITAENRSELLANPPVLQNRLDIKPQAQSRAETKADNKPPPKTSDEIKKEMQSYMSVMKNTVGGNY